MHLFSRKGRVPDPQISVQLNDDCRGPFRPGSRIRGTVTLQSPVQQQLHHGEAIFFGRAVTHCTRVGSMGTNYFRHANFSTNETIHYHDDACLFRYSQNLSQNTRIEPDRPFVWQFDFSFPRTASLVGRSPYTGRTAFSGIYFDTEHPLPPAFVHVFNDHHYVRVEYTVQVVIVLADRQEPVTVQLPFLELLPALVRPSPSGFLEYVRPPEHFSSARLLGNKTPNNAGVFGKSSSNASVNVCIKASLPSQVIAGSNLPISACVEIDNFSDPAIVPPSLNIRITSLKLSQIIAFRALLVRGMSPQPEYQEVGDVNIPLDVGLNNITVAPLRKPSGRRPFAFFPITFEARIPNVVCPSFRTFNINNNFYLKCTIEADLYGKKFEHEFAVETFAILPPA